MSKRQTFRSQYGRPSISVTALCPTRAISARLGRTHVGTPLDEIERLIRSTVADARARGVAGWTPAAERTAVRFALWCHAENRAAYAWVMSGKRNSPDSDWLAEMVAEHGHGGI